MCLGSERCFQTFSSSHLQLLVTHAKEGINPRSTSPIGEDRAKENHLSFLPGLTRSSPPTSILPGTRATRDGSVCVLHAHGDDDFLHPAASLLCPGPAPRPAPPSAERRVAGTKKRDADAGTTPIRRRFLRVENDSGTTRPGSGGW